MPPRWDPSDVAAGAGQVTTAQTDIWGLDPDTAGSGITVDYGNHPNPGTTRRLDPYDQADAAKTDRAATTASYADLMANPMKLYQKDPKAFLALQQAMFAAGFFGTTDPKNVQWGQYTDQTVSAWEKVLKSTLQAQSAGYDLTPDDILRRGVEGGKAAGGAAAKPGQVISYTDPAAIAGSVQRAAQSSLGRNLTDEELQHFVSEFHAAETSYGQQRNKAANDVTGGNFNLTSPDLSARAEQYVQENNGTEIAGNNMADYVSVIQRLLGG